MFCPRGQLLCKKGLLLSPSILRYAVVSICPVTCTGQLQLHSFANAHSRTHSHSHSAPQYFSGRVSITGNKDFLKFHSANRYAYTRSLSTSDNMTQQNGEQSKLSSRMSDSKEFFDETIPRLLSKVVSSYGDRDG